MGIQTEKTAEEGMHLVRQDSDRGWEGTTVMFSHAPTSPYIQKRWDSGRRQRELSAFGS